MAEQAAQQTASRGCERVVLVTRPSRLQVLLERQGTRGQAEFFLRSRGHSISPLEEEHARQEAALATVKSLLPAELKRTEVDRSELDRFLFAPGDLVLLVGQDGLVANCAKYLQGQLAAGINPDSALYEGVLCRHAPAMAGRLLDYAAGEEDGGLHTEHRCMALARREDGQELLALNDIFIGHSSHQSARYRLFSDNLEERQSSSGIICSTGTGATGWGRSIVLERGIEAVMPAPQERTLAWFVREPWPSVSTGAELSFGYCVDGHPLRVVSEMGSGGVIFADGIENDRLEFVEGQSVELGLAAHTLNLVMPNPA